MSCTVRWSTGPSPRDGISTLTLVMMPYYNWPIVIYGDDFLRLFVFYHNQPVIMAPAPLQNGLAHIVIREVLGRPWKAHVLNDVGRARRQHGHGCQKRVHLVYRIVGTVIDEQVNIRARVLDELLDRKSVV